MYYFNYPDSDTTIYEGSLTQSLNSGIDPILEVQKLIDDSGATHGAATSADGIMMIALDLDNNNVYFGTGGNWFDGSGNAD